MAIDDVGSGFSSFRHVTRVNPEILKLDRTLVCGIDDDPVRQSLAAAIVSFARDVGAMVVSEGIESERELACLRELAVGCGQGFFIARPNLGAIDAKLRELTGVSIESATTRVADRRPVAVAVLVARARCRAARGRARRWRGRSARRARGDGAGTAPPSASTAAGRTRSWARAPGRAAVGADVDAADRRVRRTTSGREQLRRPAGSVAPGGELERALDALAASGGPSAGTRPTSGTASCSTARTAGGRRPRCAPSHLMLATPIQPGTTSRSG